MTQQFRTEPVRNGLEIAVIGMSGRFPGARSIEEFWQVLRSGKECITRFDEGEHPDERVISHLQGSPGTHNDTARSSEFVRAKGILEGTDLFDAAFFGYSPAEARVMDPQQRIFLECAYEALESAGYGLEHGRGLTGIFAGAGLNTYLLTNLDPMRLTSESLDSLQMFIGNGSDFLVTRAAYKLGLEGPSVVVQSACSTSLVAIHQACKALLGGECDLALAGGVTVKFTDSQGYTYSEGGILAPDGHCRAFDAHARGFVPGNGAGVVVLKRLEDALADRDTICAVVRGSAVNNDGAHRAGYSTPRVKGQADVIRAALIMADVPADSISYIEAHGTGTRVGDAIELAALAQAFRESTDRKQFCAIGSVKTNIGHLDAAAGVAGFIKTVLALQNRQLPASLNFERPNPEIDFAASPFFVNDRLVDWNPSGWPRRAGISSFGMGGTNAHVILEEAPEVTHRHRPMQHQLLMLSARTDSALEAMTDRLATHLRRHPDLHLADAAFTLAVGRRRFDHRRIVVCRGVADAITALEQRDVEHLITATEDNFDRPVTFLFPGQGAQYVDMGRELYQREPVFRETIDACAGILEAHLGEDIRQLLYPAQPDPAGEERLKQTGITQPTMFVIEYALAKLLGSWGLRPNAMIGHSIGEYVAATLAGVLSLEDALALVAARGRLMQSLPAGAMLAVHMPASELEPLLETLGLHEVSIGAINAPELVVASGTEAAVARLEAALGERSIAARKLVTSHAFHSHMMDPVLEAFGREVRRMALHPPAIPYVSSETGTWITPAEATDPDYWVRHLRNPVRFSDGVRTLMAEARRIYLEVGPGITLSTLVRTHLKTGGAHVIFSTLRHASAQVSDAELLLTTLGRLWLQGAEIDWSTFFRDQRCHRVPLPVYPFERQRYWMERSPGHGRPEAPGGGGTPRGTSKTGLEIRDPHHGEPATGPSIRPAAGQEAGRGRASGAGPVQDNVARIFREILGTETIGPEDNFFDLGGDSLMAVQVMQRVSEAFAVNPSVDRFLQEPTVAAATRLVEAIVSKTLPARTALDLNAEVVLDPDIRIEPATETRDQYDAIDPQAIFFTGATGYVGAFLLDELLRETGATVYCLVRADSLERGLARIQANLEKYGLWRDVYRERIVPVAGDLTRHRLGLSDVDYDRLARACDVIFHAGAWANHLFPYATMKAANVIGTQEVLRFACRLKVKPVHYISTIGVFASMDYSGSAVVEEVPDPPLGGEIYDGYCQSKWVAEKLVWIAHRRGIPVAVYRPGELLGHSRTGAFNSNDTMNVYIKKCVEIGSYPDLDLVIQLAPIDFCVQAIVHIALHVKAMGKPFHLVNPYPVDLNNVFGWLSSRGFPIQKVPDDVWQQRLIASLEDEDDSVQYAHVKLFTEKRLDLDITLMEFWQNHPYFVCRNMLKALIGSSLVCPPFDERLFEAYFASFLDRGFFRLKQGTAALRALAQPAPAVQRGAARAS